MLNYGFLINLEVIEVRKKKYSKPAVVSSKVFNCALACSSTAGFEGCYFNPKMDCGIPAVGPACSKT